MYSCRIVPFHFLARCHKMQLNHTLPDLSVILDFQVCFVLFFRAALIVYFVFLCVLLLCRSLLLVSTGQVIG